MQGQPPPIPDPQTFEPLRCKRCRALLLEGKFKKARIEIKCRRCKYLNIFLFKDGKRVKE